MSTFRLYFRAPSGTPLLSSSRESLTPSSGTSPLASYKEIPSRHRRTIVTEEKKIMN